MFKAVARATRIDNNKALHAIVEEAMKQKSSAEWNAIFAKNDIPAGRVLSIPETAKLDHYGHRTIMQTVDTEYGPIKVVGSGFRLEHDGGSIERPPATVGQHTDEVLAEAGYTPAEIADLRAAKVV